MNILPQLSIPLLIALSFALFLLFIQWLYLRVLYFLPSHRQKRDSKGLKEYVYELPPMSIVVYAHNDADYLAEHLPLILKQDYPTFEVIVVSDGSTDDTSDLVSRLEQEHPNLHYTFVPEITHNVSRKKLALTLGVKAARYDIVLFTYANARPVSDNWLKMMGRNFVPNIDVVIGYAYIEPTKEKKGGYLYFDRLLYSLRYLSASILHKTYRGRGSNLAYRKSLFFAHKGYAKYLNLEFGDEDLFINDITTKQNTRVEIQPDSFVACCYNNPTQAWVAEAKLYHFTARYMHNATHTWQGMEMLFRYLFYASLGGILFFSAMQWQVWVAALLLFLLFYIPYAIGYWCAARRYASPRSLLLLPFFDLARPWVWLYFRLLGMTSRSRNSYLTTTPHL